MVAFIGNLWLFMAVVVWVSLLFKLRFMGQKKDHKHIWAVIWNPNRHVAINALCCVLFILWVGFASPYVWYLRYQDYRDGNW